MSTPLDDAIRAIRELPDEQQDAIAHQLMRLIELEQSNDMELASASGAELS
jgi:hypothetical protein